MKASIHDVKTVASIRPLELAAYLRSNGWRETASRPGMWSRWVRSSGATGKADDSEFEVLLPLDAHFRDFALRIGDLLQTLEIVERRSQLEIVNDLLSAAADIIRVRIADAEAADGSIPFDDGVQIVQRARDMVLAAACSAAEHRAYFSTRKPTQAVEYLRKTRLGQTEHGSYVVKILSRVPPTLIAKNGQRTLEVIEPFERQVTETLAKSLAALSFAAESAARSGELDTFQAAVGQGVSANLCDAILGMSNAAERQRDIEIEFSWSRSRPMSDANVPARVFLPSDAMPLIQAASEYFKHTAPREEFRLHGFVVKLERGEGQATGLVTIFGFVDDHPRRVQVQLPDAEYHIAVQAHDQQHPISCLGNLVREGRSYRLLSPHGLSVVPEPSDG